MAAQREWFEKDYYKVLGVKDDAAPKDITKAYRKLARELHPDKNPGDAAAEERFKEVSAAYDVLGDETKRKEYDEVRRLGPMGGGGMRWRPGGFRFNVGDMQGGGIGDLFGQMFGRGRSRRRAASGVGPQRGADVSAELTLDFADAVRGLTTTLHLTSRCAVLDVQRLGRQARHQRRRCARTAAGAGSSTTTRACSRSRRRAAIARAAAPSSRSRARRARARASSAGPREVQARIPAGVNDGQTIRLKGRGGPGRNGGPPGDLLVDIQVTPHRHFGRSGNDLTVKVPIDFCQAALGGEIDVPTLDGQRVMLRVKPGTQSGQPASGPRQGHRRHQEGRTTTGDLIVTVDVEVPTQLTDERARGHRGAQGRRHCGTGGGSDVSERSEHAMGERQRVDRRWGSGAQRPGVR